MNLYQTQHAFYCGIDFHANEMYACVVDQNGSKLLHRNFKTRQPEKLFEQLEPFSSDVIVGCESTFNWYWLCDTREERKIPFLLGHALYLKAIHGGKVKSDKIDSEKLARLLRGGNFAVSYAYPSDWRATRDLLRRRGHFVSRRGETLAHCERKSFRYRFVKSVFKTVDAGVHFESIDIDDNRRKKFSAEPLTLGFIKISGELQIGTSRR